MSCTKRKKTKADSRKKKIRKIENWAGYSKGLKARGDIRLWIGPKTLKQWHYSGKRGHGGHFIYSDYTRLCCTARKTMNSLYFQVVYQATL